MRDFDLKWSKGARSVVEFGGGKHVRVFGECCSEGVDSAGFPTGGVKCEVNLSNVRGYHIPEAEE